MTLRVRHRWYLQKWWSTPSNTRLRWISTLHCSSSALLERRPPPSQDATGQTQLSGKASSQYTCANVLLLCKEDSGLLVVSRFGNHDMISAQLLFPFKSFGFRSLSFLSLFYNILKLILCTQGTVLRSCMASSHQISITCEWFDLSTNFFLKMIFTKFRLYPMKAVGVWLFF